MIDVDFQNEEVKEAIGKLAAETGMSSKEIIKEFECAENHKVYVRFIKGVAKGKVGYYLPDTEPFPYARCVFCPDGSEVVAVGWGSSFEVISEEEYLKECEESADV